MGPFGGGTGLVAQLQGNWGQPGRTGKSAVEGGTWWKIIGGRSRGRRDTLEVQGRSDLVTSFQPMVPGTGCYLVARRPYPGLRGRGQ